MADDEDEVEFAYVDPMYAVAVEDYARLREAGSDHADAWDLAIAGLRASLDASPPRLVADLLRRAPETLADHRQSREGFEQRLRDRWGEALDLYYVVHVVAQEAAATFDREHRAESAATQDHLFDALTGITARACRISREVHHLLEGGYPLGALARSRTLMELSIVATILADYSNRPGFADIAEKFRLHGEVRAYHEAVVYRSSDGQKVHPITDVTFAELAATRKARVERFGKDYDSVNGWASGVNEKAQPKDRDLREAANLGHARHPHYSWASNETHAGSRGWGMNTIETGGQAYRMAGATNMLIPEAAHNSLLALNNCLVLFLFCRRPDIEPTDLVTTQAVQQLVQQTGDAFERAWQAQQEDRQSSDGADQPDG